MRSSDTRGYQGTPSDIAGEEVIPHQSAFKRLLSGDRRGLQVVLFLLTIASTYIAIGSFIYTTAILLILLAHEFGHYVMCRRHGISATLPYFIPMPLPPFGTLGAVIAMRQRIPNRKALFDVAAAGPLAGLFLAFPAILIGLNYSTVIDPSNLSDEVISMGEPIAFQLARYLVIGPLPEGMDVMVHPLAYAGWVGLFVTALNLLPIGQLDGGHIAYAMFGKHSKYIFIVALILFAVSAFFFPGWILMLILLAFLFFKHPPTWDDITPLDARRKVLGILMFIIFALTFTPIPFQF